MEIANIFINKIAYYKLVKMMIGGKSNEKSLVLLSLYAFLFIELIYFFMRGFWKLSLILLILGLCVIIGRVLFSQTPNSYWSGIRIQLKKILIRNDVIPNDGISPIEIIDELVEAEATLPIVINSENIAPLTIEHKQGVVKELRSVGLDGLLICLFLLKNEDIFCSAKNISRAIDMPQTTTYRYLAKLHENEYIFAKQTFDNPQSNYFQLTVNGKFLIYDLYNLIKYQN